MKRNHNIPVAPQDRKRRPPLDEWEKKRIAAMLERGMSSRKIASALGLGYRTVCRFAQELSTEKSPTCEQVSTSTVTEKQSLRVASSLRSSRQGAR